MAFPCLFPTGDADFTQPCRKKLDLHKWVKHLMRYRDSRFATRDFPSSRLPCDGANTLLACITRCWASGDAIGDDIVRGTGAWCGKDNTGSG